MTSPLVLRLPKLDARLETIASLVPKCALAADIAADHGLLSAHLLHRGQCQRMIVSDISEQSLDKARRLLDRHGLSKRADFIVADGFDAIDRPPDAVIVSGLGGDTISGMLGGAPRLAGAPLLLCAQTDTPLLRASLMRAGYVLVRELVLKSAGRFYSVIHAVPGKADYSPQMLFSGICLRATASASPRDYLAWRLRVALAARDGKAQQIKWLEEALAHEDRDQSHHI
ncbi:MAG: tRNA (adenine(22)-N(1))-methyltransferase TrmK [Christensenellales bacterium]